MEKKYELIKDKFGLTRIRALKDFTLITGETVKKGDLGGCVVSEDRLSQEGNCWVKDYTGVFGKVFGNAVVKNHSQVCGAVSGNAVVKDHGYVGVNATVTDNAVVQAWQRIRYGTVTTDLLGTKDWIGALYAELGIRPKDGKITLYKRVWNTNNPNVFESVYNRKFIYEIGKEAIETDVDENVMKYCGKGLHFTTLEFIDDYEGNTILECEVAHEDILTVQDGIIRARKCRVLGIFKE